MESGAPLRHCGEYGLIAVTKFLEIAWSVAPAIGESLFRRAFGENPLQRAPMHVEAARGFRNVTTAQFVNALDVFPTHAIGGHWIFRRLDLSIVDSQQRGGDVIGVDRLRQIINGAELDGILGGRG